MPIDSDETKRQYQRQLEELKTIYDRLVRAYEGAEEERQNLIKQNAFSSAQCRRAIQKLLAFEDSMKDLGELFGQKPLLQELNEQRRRISMIVDVLEDSKKDLVSKIDSFASNEYSQIGIGNIRQNIINSLSKLMEALKKILDILNDIQSKTSKVALTNVIPFSNFSILIKEGGVGRSGVEPISDMSLSKSSTSREVTDVPKTPAYSSAPAFIRFVKGLFTGFNDREMPKESAREEGLPASNISPLVSEEIRRQSSQGELFEYLKKILVENIEEDDLREICDELKVNYNDLAGKSHAAKASSLTRKMNNEVRLDELEDKLSKRLPKRFPWK